MADWMVIANPASGGGRGRRAAEAAVRGLGERGIRADLAFTEGRGDGARLAERALLEGAGRVVVCGGDGTAHEALGALAGSDAALGLVPCGRGNDLARALGIPECVDGAAEVIASGRTRRIDLGRVGGRYFGTVACLGFDSAVAQRVYENRARFSGRAAYAAAMFAELARYRCPEVRVEGDFGAFEGPAMLAATGNTSCYGGGIRILPDAVCDDGLLDLCIIREVSRLAALRLFPKVLRGAHAGLPQVRMARSRSVRVASAEPLWIFADGEPVCRTPARIEVVAGAVKVLCP